MLPKVRKFVTISSPKPPMLARKAALGHIALICLG